MTFSEYSEEFINRALIQTRPETQATVRSHIRAHLLPAFGNRTLDQIDQRNVQEFITKLSLEKAPTTVRNIWASLRLILAEAECESLITKIPKPRFRSMPIAEHQPRFSLEHLRRILTKAPAEDRPLYWILAETGVRIEEALGLEPKDVVGHQVMVRGTKTESAFRQLSLSSQGLEAMQAAPFRASESTYRNHLRSLLFGLGLMPCGFHAFRRSNADLMEELGVPASIADYRHGHPPQDIRRRVYVKYRPDDRDWANKIAEALL